MCYVFSRCEKQGQRNGTGPQRQPEKPPRGTLKGGEKEQEVRGLVGGPCGFNDFPSGVGILGV